MKKTASALSSLSQQPHLMPKARIASSLAKASRYTRQAAAARPMSRYAQRADKYTGALDSLSGKREYIRNRGIPTGGTARLNRMENRFARRSANAISRMKPGRERRMQLQSLNRAMSDRTGISPMDGVRQAPLQTTNKPRGKNYYRMI